jgi:hypothetical protein
MAYGLREMTLRDTIAPQWGNMLIEKIALF